MKILRIISAGYEQGGAENGVVLTNRILKARNHTVKVLSSDVEPEKEHFSDFEFKGVYPSGIKKVITAAFNFDAYRVTKKIVKEFEPDVVLLHTLSQPTASVLFAVRNVPSILVVHGPEIYTPSLLAWYLPAKLYKNQSYILSDLTMTGRLHYYYFKYVCGLFYRIGLRYVDQVVALSHYTQRFLKTDTIQSSYIPNGVKVTDKITSENRSHNLLYAGRLEIYKGITDLLSAMPAILKKYPDTVLHIAGDGSCKSELLELVDRLKLHASIKFLGQLRTKQLASQYENCAIFIMPSRWPETFGKVGVEAMSYGKPVVATDVGGVKDWLEDEVNGLLIQPEQPDQIASAIIRLLSDTEFATRASTSARKTASKFTIEQFATNIESLALKLSKK